MLIDLHIHTVHSDGSNVVADVAKQAAKKKVICGICDHISPYHNIFQEDNFDAYVWDVRSSGLLLGGELCAGAPCPVGREKLAELDYVLLGVHLLTMEGRRYYFWGQDVPRDGGAFVEQYIESVAASLEKSTVDVLAHPTYLPEPLMSQYDELWTDDRCRRLWESVRRAGAAVEISGRWLVPRERPLRLALDMGLRVSFGSDAHHPYNLFELTFPLQQARALGIPEEKIFAPSPTPLTHGRGRR